VPGDRPYYASFGLRDVPVHDPTVEPMQWREAPVNPWKATDIRPYGNTEKLMYVNLNDMFPGQQIAFVDSMPSIKYTRDLPLLQDNAACRGSLPMNTLVYEEPVERVFRWRYRPGCYNPSRSNDSLSSLVHAVDERMCRVEQVEESISFYHEKGHSSVLLIDWVTGLSVNEISFNMTNELTVSFKKPTEYVVNPYKPVCSIDKVIYNNDTGEIIVEILEHRFSYDGNPSIFGEDAVGYERQIKLKTFKMKIKSNLQPNEDVSKDRKPVSGEGAELVAIETLREMISESKFRRYLKNGFITVNASDGKTYQVFRDKWHTKVWKKGKLVEEICTRLSTNVPPTDNVIAFKTMLECDIKEFKSIGNVYNMRKVA